MYMYKLWFLYSEQSITRDSIVNMHLHNIATDCKLGTWKELTTDASVDPKSGETLTCNKIRME